MATFKLDFGQNIELLTKGEVAEVLAKRDTQRRADLAGKKYIPRVRLQGYAVGGVLDIGGDTIATLASGQPAWAGRPLGPQAGYAWAVRRLVINGLTASATAPDVVNIYIHGAAGGPDWQLNGNEWGQTFSHTQFVFEAGESLRLASLGTFAATGLVTAKMALFQVPAERLGELG